MQVNSFKAILAAVSVAAFASACTSKGSDKAAIAAAIKASACPAAGAAARLSPDQLQLSNEMQKFEPCFDVSKTFLSGKIGGISIDSIATGLNFNAGTDSINGSSSAEVKGSLILRAAMTTYTFGSGVFNLNDLRSGKTIDLTINDPKKTLESELGGLLDIKIRCMDAECKSVSLWMQSYQLGRINSAGVIFTADASNNYSLAVSQQGMIFSVARYVEKTTRSGREDDGVSAPEDNTPSFGLGSY